MGGCGGGSGTAGSGGRTRGGGACGRGSGQRGVDGCVGARNKVLDSIGSTLRVKPKRMGKSSPVKLLLLAGTVHTRVVGAVVVAGQDGSVLVTEARIIGRLAELEVALGCNQALVEDGLSQAGGRARGSGGGSGLCRDGSSECRDGEDDGLHIDG